MYVKKPEEQQEQIRDFVRKNLYLLKEYKNCEFKVARADARIDALLTSAQQLPFWALTPRRTIFNFLKTTYKTIHNYPK